MGEKRKTAMPRVCVHFLKKNTEKTKKGMYQIVKIYFSYLQRMANFFSYLLLYYCLTLLFKLTVLNL